MKMSNVVAKNALSLVLGLMMAVGLAVPVCANDGISVTIDGERVSFEGQQPVIVDGRTLVPVRGVFEMLGFEVNWEGATSTAIITNADYEMRITVGNNQFTTNGAAHTLDVPSQNIGSRTMVPIRLPLESVGYDLNWDGATSTVLIMSEPMESQAGQTQQEGASPQNTAVVNELFEKLNHERVRNGLQPLVLNAQLSAIATEHAMAMAQFEPTPEMPMGTVDGLSLPDRTNAAKLSNDFVGYLGHYSGLQPLNAMVSTTSTDNSAIFGAEWTDVGIYAVAAPQPNTPNGANLYAAAFVTARNANTTAAATQNQPNQGQQPTSQEQQSTTQGQQLPVNNLTADEFERRVFELTNVERAKYGMPQLVWCDYLARAARAHSKDLVINNLTGHIGSDNSTPAGRVMRAGGVNTLVGENVTYQRLTPEAAVESWMNSSGHRAIILSAESVFLGVGFHVDPNNARNTVITQNFSTTSADPLKAPAWLNVTFAGENGALIGGNSVRFIDNNSGLSNENGALNIETTRRDISITAEARAPHVEFVRWELAWGNATIANPYSATTTVTLHDLDVSVNAVFRSLDE